MRYRLSLIRRVAPEDNVWGADPGDIQPVEFLEGIQSIAFNYFDKDGNPIADPDAAEDSIVHVTIDVQIQPPGSAPQTLSSGATLRIRERR